MQPNTALGLILSGAAAFALTKRSRSTPALLWIHVSALTVLSLGAACLSQYIFGWDLGIDRIFLPESYLPTHPFAGRPSPQTSFNFVVFGATLLYLAWRKKSDLLVQFGAMIVGALGTTVRAVAPPRHRFLRSLANVARSVASTSFSASQATALCGSSRYSWRRYTSPIVAAIRVSCRPCGSVRSNE